MNLHRFVSNTFDLAAYPTKEKLVSAVQLNALQLINSGQKVSIEEIPALVEQVWVEKATNPAQGANDPQPEQTAVTVAEPEVQVIEPGPLFRPITSRPSVPYVAPVEDNVDDDVIVGKLVALFDKELTDAEALVELRKEFDLSEDDKKELLKLAHKKYSDAIEEARPEAQAVIFRVHQLVEFPACHLPAVLFRPRSYLGQIQPGQIFLNRRKEAAAAFLQTQAQVIEKSDRALAVYEAALKEVAEAQSLHQLQHAQVRRVQENIRAGADYRLSLDGAEIQASILARAQLDALARAQRALGDLEDAVQRPLAPGEMPPIRPESPSPNETSGARNP